MSLLNVTRGGMSSSEGEMGIDIWKRRGAGAYGPFLGQPWPRFSNVKHTFADKKNTRPQSRVSWAQGQVYSRWGIMLQSCTASSQSKTLCLKWLKRD